ncbi:MAG: hypothetical protein H0T89_11310 [Deltaproteobacteria bacterium]|nr:hypothetical protein [Deltaproteobacteria bacterium]MDQ3296103.1 hypothetical protein [Myxococcota bacterium]
MKSPSVLWLAVVAVVALFGGSTGCPDSGTSNPPTLWLALDGRETEVKLVEDEPEPF